MKVCKSCSASGIELEITTYRKSLLYFLFQVLHIFSEDRKSFLCPALLISAGHSHSTSRNRLRNSSTGATVVASTHAFIVKAGIACEPIHRKTSSAVVRPANTCMETRLKN